MPRSLAVLACTLALAALVHAQQRGQPPQPTFQARVDVVAVDVHAIDSSGRPVPDLRPDEFTVKVDGKPRPIQTADYIAYGLTTTTTPAPAVAERPQPLFTSNRVVAGTRPGRWMLLVVDEENIRSGYARQAAQAAQRFLDQAQPGDRVGLVVIPTSGVAIDPTTDRAPVREALQHVAGHMVPVETTLNAIYHLALSEAFTFRHDPPRWAPIIDRECTRPGVSKIPVGLFGQGLSEADILAKYPQLTSYDVQQYLQCKAEVEHNAQTMMQDVRQRTLNSTRALLGLLEGIARVPGPKTVVFISEELPVSSYLGERADFNAEVNPIKAAAARAQATFYVLHLDRPPFDVADKLGPTNSAADSDMRSFGLETVTSLTGGKRLMVSGRVEAAMDRIALELSGYYLLGVRTEPGDRDGKPHEIKIAVSRKGVEMRARPMFVIDELTRNAAETASELVNRLLRTSVPASDLPLAVATYALPNPDAGGASVRLLISAEIDRGITQAAPITVGYSILDQRGNNVGASVEQSTLEPGRDDPDGGLRYLAAAVVPPGSYTVRVAAADPGLRAGSVQHRVEAKLTDAVSLRLGDLVVFDRYLDQSGKPRPSVSATVSGSLSCYLEVLGGAAGLPSGFNVRIEIADALDARPGISAAMLAQPSAGTTGRAQLSGSLPLGDLPPGDYLAKAIVSKAGTDVALVTRPVRVVAGAPAQESKPIPAKADEPGLKPDPANEPRPTPAKADVLGAPIQAGGAYTKAATTVGEIIERAGRYVAEYGQQMSLIIGVERYAQWMQNEDAPRPVSRQIVSEFALVRTKDDWDGFRDVYEVDGKPVADRQDRLLKLFTETPAVAAQQGRQIANESARYNMGSIQRNFNVPTTALFFVKADNQARFTFRKDGEDSIDGVAVWKVRYEETRKPTIIRTASGKDMPVHGTLWIDPVQGRVLKTHMEITSEAMLTADHGAMSNNPGGYLGNAPAAQTRWGDNRRVNTSASITVTYRQEPRWGLLVPAEMLETYEGPTRSAFTGNESVSKINCRATYSDFKRFETGGRVVPK
jgi:VWFA-related protein